MDYLNNKKILLTGSTGLLGFQILLKLIKLKNSQIYLLIRGDLKKKTLLINNYLNFFGLKSLDSFNNVFLINDDLENKSLLSDFQYLIDRIDIVIHSASCIDFNLTKDKSEAVNINGTKNLFNFFKKNSNLLFVYISTVFIVGKSLKRLYETDLILNQKFNNFYEWSKYQSELFLKKQSNSNIIIFRPSIILGHYESGFTNDFNLIYQTLRIISKGYFKKFPINTTAELNIIPSNIAAKSILELTDYRNTNKTFHIINPNIITGPELFYGASQFLNFDSPEYIDINNFDFNSLSFVQSQMIANFIPYLRFDQKFNCEFTESCLNKIGLSLSFDKDLFLKNIFHYLSTVKYL